MNDEDIELKVCLKCDAPLPNDKKRMTFFNKNLEICDDCINLNKVTKADIHSLCCYFYLNKANASLRIFSDFSISPF